MTKKPDNIEDILFEIARTMDYVRHDPRFVESQDYMIEATGYFKATPVGRFMDMELIEWKGGKKSATGGDWYGTLLIPSCNGRSCRIFTTHC